MSVPVLLRASLSHRRWRQVTPAEQQAIDRLTAYLNETKARHGDSIATRTLRYGPGLTMDDLRALLSLLRPRASVEGVVTNYPVESASGDFVRVSAFVEGSAWFDSLVRPWPGAKEGQPVRIDMHAINGEEK